MTDTNRDVWLTLIDDWHRQMIDIDCNRWFTDCDRWHWCWHVWHGDWHWNWPWQMADSSSDRWLTLTSQLIDTDRDRGLTLWRDVTAANELWDDGVEFGELGVLVFDWWPRALVQRDQHEAGGHAQSQQLLLLLTNTRGVKMTSQREHVRARRHSVTLTWDRNNLHIGVTDLLRTDCWQSALAITNHVGATLGVYHIHIIWHNFYVNVSF